jgi:hypothetical protein
MSGVVEVGFATVASGVNAGSLVAVGGITVGETSVEVPVALTDVAEDSVGAWIGCAIEHALNTIRVIKERQR